MTPPPRAPAHGSELPALAVRPVRVPRAQFLTRVVFPMSRFTPLAPLLGALIGLCVVLAFARCAPVDAGTAVKLDVPGLVDRAELVFEGRVRAIECARDDRGRIETRYTIDVSRTLFGDALPARVVRVPGGVLPDGSGLVLPGLPRLALDEEALLFLSAESRAGLRVPVGLAQGRFRIEHTEDGGKRFVRDVTDLALVDEHGHLVPEGAAAQTFDYAETIARVQAAVSVRQARERAERGSGK